MFDGLYLYEIVLLILGVVLFLVLTGVLIVFVRRRQSIKVLLTFYVIPILMIGFPGISSFEISRGTIKIQQRARELKANPKDVAKREEVKTELEMLEGRQFRSPNYLLSIAQGKSVVGDTKGALEFADRTLAVDPSNVEANNLHGELVLSSLKKELLGPSRFIASETSDSANNRLINARELNQLADRGVFNNDLFTNYYADSVLMMQPNHRLALMLKKHTILTSR